MGWHSTTRVVSVAPPGHKEVWKRIQTSERVAKASGEAEKPEKTVCCFWMQNKCRFGDTCEFSHDVKDLPEFGCTYGVGCKYGHCDHVIQGGHSENSNKKPLVQLTGDPSRIMDSLLGTAGEASRPATSYLECTGPNYDDSDPLWDELATALREAGEDTGDGDLSNVTRARLAAQELYTLIDKDLADEWLCLPAASLVPMLARKRDRVQTMRQEWRAYDVAEMKSLWSEELRCGSLAYEFDADVCGDAGGELGEEARLLTHAVKEASKALDLAFATAAPPSSLEGAPGQGPQPSPPTFHPLGSEEDLGEAIVAVRKVHRLRDLVKLAEVSGMGCALRRKAFDGMGALALGADNAAGGAGAESLPEICRGLERSLFMRRSARADMDGMGDDAELAAPRTSLSSGMRASIRNLPAPFEAGLLDRACVLEKYNEELKAWQVQLEDSGTRLLLPVTQLLPLAGVADARVLGSRPASRSRSPHGIRGALCGSVGRPEGVARAESMLQLARAAAQRGEFVVVHHVVSWYGADAELERDDDSWLAGA